MPISTKEYGGFFSVGKKRTKRKPPFSFGKEKGEKKTE
jgi:hypothetical protein